MPAALASANPEPVSDPHATHSSTAASVIVAPERTAKPSVRVRTATTPRKNADASDRLTGNHGFHGSVHPPRSAQTTSSAAKVTSQLRTANPRSIATNSTHATPTHVSESAWNDSHAAGSSQPLTPTAMSTPTTTPAKPKTLARTCSEARRACHNPAATTAARTSHP